MADEAWALRIPATVASAASVVLLGLIAREVGGDRRAVALAAWGGAFAGLPLALGHVLLTSTVDLPFTLAVVLTVLMALRTNPRWWLAAGALAGLATWNRLLVPLLLLGVVLGLALLGPRAPLRTRWPWLGGLVAAVVGAPNLAYQWLNDWPQLAMGAALSENNAADVRADLPLILLIAIGPPLVVVWLAGIREAWRQPRARWLLVPAALLLVFTVTSGAQPHYPLVMLATLYAVGCVPLSRWVGDHAWRRVLVVGLVGLNAVVSTIVALPVVPVTVLGGTPLPDLSILVADQVGWPRYVARVAQVASQTDDPGAVVITTNYGEAGAVARYGPALGLPAPYSGQNDLGTVAGHPRAPARWCSSAGSCPTWTARSPPVRCWPGSTTESTSTTRSRARRWPCAATRCCRGHSCGPGSPTSTEGTPTDCGCATPNAARGPVRGGTSAMGRGASGGWPASAAQVTGA